MNFGDCPYDDCNGFLGMFEVPERTPAYAPTECPECGRTVWYKFSRLDPMAYTEESFLADHDIDWENHIITEKARGEV